MENVDYGPVNPQAPFVWHGGDYNPEQWDSSIWDEDMDLMQKSYFTVPTLGVFSWVSLQPSETRFDFTWLDTVLDKLSAAGRHFILATPTAAQPAWMSYQYPSVLRADNRGVRRHHGFRVNYCVTSTVYRNFARQMAERLARRYGTAPGLVAWHVSNEYGGQCFCEGCANEFRVWLKERYDGSLENLNAKWWTKFWGHTYTRWEQIQPPYADGENRLHALTLDWNRFQDEAALSLFKLERDVLRAFSLSHIPITTNMMGTYPWLNYRRWAREVDVISWDCYPQPNDQPSDIAFSHDLMRGLKDGRPFVLMEQTPSSQNWQPVNALKRPGVMRLWSYLAMAHGSDAVMYFQWRRGRGGCEKFHGAVVEHARRTDARVFQEVSKLGEELQALGSRTLGGRTNARVAIIYDWENRWAIEASVGPMQDKRYLPTVKRHYGAFWRRNVPVDMVFPDSELERYDVVVAPMLYMVKKGVVERLERHVANGGVLVVTYSSGIADETDIVFEGYPGPLKSVLGIWNEEVDALYQGQTNEIVLLDGLGTYKCSRLCEIIHCEGAESIANYGKEFYAGGPVVTKNMFGKGEAYYIATDPEDRFLDDFYGDILAELNIEPPLHVPQ
ncbi:beta-galactosidase, partial [Jimgerdemannia flammicorona]